MRYRVRISIVIVAVCLLGLGLAWLVRDHDAVPSMAVSQPSIDGMGSGEPVSHTKTKIAIASASDEEKGNRMYIRAEGTGEKFASLESSEVVYRLTQSTDRIVQRKTAKVLGDRNLAGKLSLSQDERADLDKYIDKQVTFTAAATGEDRTEANDQIRRLWRLTADKLIDSLGSRNRTIVEAATKNLALMRDADIVRKIIAGIEASNDASFRRNAILTLGMMREKRDCLVPDRHKLGDKESEAMATEIIVPFLTKLQTSEKDAETLQIIKMAFHFLNNPPDARLRPSNQQ